uniref:Uncharacterized protein n=1 Tax=Megaselia scalaris TaxID=36166 RepID=T1H5X3_MEGSC
VSRSRFSVNFLFMFYNVYENGLNFWKKLLKISDSFKTRVTVELPGLATFFAFKSSNNFINLIVFDFHVFERIYPFFTTLGLILL